MINVVMHDFAELLPFWQLESLNTVYNKSRKLPCTASAPIEFARKRLLHRLVENLILHFWSENRHSTESSIFFLSHINWLNILEFTKPKVSLISLRVKTFLFLPDNLSSWRDTSVPTLSRGGVVMALFPIHYLLRRLIAMVRPWNEIYRSIDSFSALLSLDMGIFFRVKAIFPRLRGKSNRGQDIEE